MQNVQVPRARSTSLKKRFLSRGVFDGVEGDCAGGIATGGWCRGALERRRRLESSAAREGGQGRPGTGRRGGALTARWCCCRQPPWRWTAGWRSWSAQWWLGSADRTIADREPIRGHPGSGARTSFRSVGRRMVCLPATVSTGSLSCTGHARDAGGHVVRRARVLAVPEPSQLASWRVRQRISPSRSP